MKKLGKACLIVLLTAGLIQVAPLGITVLVVVFLCMSGSPLERLNRMLDKLKAIINC